jgi:antitoxin FitA
MATIQVKNVPDEVHRVLKHRAVEEGQSLQEYLLAKLTEDTSKPTMKEWIRRIESRPDSGARVSFDEVVQIIREDRDSR